MFAVVGGSIAGEANAAVEIVPHRAIYRLALGSVRASASVADVKGRMLFQWGDACEAWTIEQHFRLDFLYTEGEEVKMTTNFVTWEAKDGSRYRFNVRKTVNGQLDEEVRGEALRAADGGGAVHFVRPEAPEMKLVAGTLFPTRHTLVLLERALAGDRFVSRSVFDGSDAEGASEISAVIGDRSPLKHGVGQAAANTPSREVLAEDAQRTHHLLGGPAWPIRLAFFSNKSDSGAPDYEMSMLLLRNGVAQSMLIDYGDFTVNAILETLEPLPRSGC